MKKYIKEIIILFIQLFSFYVLPYFSGPSDVMGLVILQFLITFILSIVVGTIINNKYKYFYPVLVSFLFIPVIFIHYNESALIYVLFYLIISIIGMFIGIIIRKAFYITKK